MKRIVISGANGFLGQNLVRLLSRTEGLKPVPVTRHDGPDRWRSAIARADGLVHLAGVTQSDDWDEMYDGNVRPAKLIAEAMEASACHAPIVYSSTVKAAANTPYGLTKKAGEEILIASARSRGAPLAIFRLPHVFGPLARAHYNSIVVTMCAEHAQGEPLSFRNPDALLELAFVDDVVRAFAQALVEAPGQPIYRSIAPLFRTTVGEVAEAIRSFGRASSGKPPALDPRLMTALRLTYQSFLPKGEPAVG